MEGIERLKTQALEMDNCHVLAIFNYLTTKTSLYEKFNNEEKTIEEMYDFICDKAKKTAINNVSIVSDNTVYLWAINYFNKSNEELGIIKKSVLPPTADKITKETKKITKKAENRKENQISMFQEVSK